MAAFGVGINGHVLLDAGERTTSGDCLQETTELGRVEGIAEGKEVWKEGDLFRVEVVERRKVACLVDLCKTCYREREREMWAKYLVDVGLFFCKRQVGDTLILDPDEQVILEKFFDEGVLEGGAGSVGGAEGGDGIVVEKQRCKILDFWTWNWLWEPSGPFADVSRIGAVSCASHGQGQGQGESSPRE